jgi:hypothetical protein
MRGPKAFLFVVLCIGCVEPYTPPVTPGSISALVVDGYIDINGSASVKLSRSIPLNANSHSPAEKGADVSIESSSGEIYTLTEGDSAVYTATDLAVSQDHTYKLRIKTIEGHEYLSDEVEIFSSPPIDNVRWGVSANGESIEIYVDAHDDNPEATGYYLWDKIETYEYKAPYYSGFRLVNGQVYERSPDEILYVCWRTDILPQEVLNTRLFAQNIISGKKLSSIPRNSPKISERYSIVVRQRMISEEEYAFRTQLQKSTEQQGNIFAVIPGTVVSNVHSLTSNDEYVLGYFRGQHTQEKRLFIDRNELPEYFQLPQDKMGCQIESTCPIVPTDSAPNNCVFVENLGGDALIVSLNTDSRGVVQSYNFVSSACGDCRLRGGSLTKPPFW